MSAKPITVLLFLFSIPTATSLDSGFPCRRRHHGESLVCVCSASYCDTLEPPEYLEAEKFYVFTSSESGLRFELTCNNRKESIQNEPPDVTVRVTTSNESQEILGFGGALSDAAGINIASLSSLTQDQLLDAYFSKTGIEYSFVRVPIGGTDFSERQYTYADAGTSDAGITLESIMNLAPEDYIYKIRYIRQILSKNPGKIKLLASAWQAPEWMTATDFTFRKTINPTHYRDWAEYHRRFFDLYKGYNISFWGATTGNEIDGGIFSMPWTMREHQIWINDHLGPILEQHGYGDLKLLLMDDVTPAMLTWQNLLRNPVTDKYISGMATHFYVDKWIYVFHNLFHMSHPSKIILNTEASFCEYEENYKHKTAWHKAESYAKNIIKKLNNFGNGWLDWNLALDTKGGPNHLNNFCDSAVLVNALEDEFYKQPMFYAMGHFSKFIPPGSKKVGASATPYNKKFHVTAARVPDSPWNLAVVVLNRGQKKLNVRVCVDDTFCGIIESPPKSILTTVTRQLT